VAASLLWCRRAEVPELPPGVEGPALAGIDPTTETPLSAGVTRLRDVPQARFGQTQTHRAEQVRATAARWRAGASGSSVVLPLQREPTTMQLQLTDYYHLSEVGSLWIDNELAGREWRVAESPYGVTVTFPVWHHRGWPTRGARAGHFRREVPPRQLSGSETFNRVKGLIQLRTASPIMRRNPTPTRSRRQ